MVLTSGKARVSAMRSFAWAVVLGSLLAALNGHGMSDEALRDILDVVRAERKMPGLRAAVRFPDRVCSM